MAELEDQARGDGLRELDFDEVNGGAAQAAGFEAGLGHARKCSRSRAERKEGDFRTLTKHRWDIEKIFHQFKSKMGERKSWASSHEAKQAHGMFECLTHNLLLLFEQYLGHSEGLRDELEEKKQQGRARATAVASLAAGIIRTAGNFINTALARATQRTQRFIRWVRVWIYKHAPWRDSIARLREVWATKSA